MTTSQNYRHLSPPRKLVVTGDPVYHPLPHRTLDPEPTQDQPIDQEKETKI